MKKIFIFFFLESFPNMAAPLRTLNRNSIVSYSFGRIDEILMKYNRRIERDTRSLCGILMLKNGKRLEIDIANIRNK